MGLCENVYRRGGVYWWRRRLNLGDEGACSYIRISLKLRDPRSARELARRVGVEADRLVRMGMLTASEQKQLLKAFVDHHAGHLETVAGLVAHQDAERGANAEPIIDRIRRERIMGAAYSVLGSRGVAAEVGDREVAALATRGFEPAEIDQVRAQVAYFRDFLPRLASDGTISAAGPNGLIGPSNTDFRRMLGLLDADATSDNVDLARRLWLQAMAVVLNDASRRHDTLGPGRAEAVFEEMFGTTGQNDAVVPTPAKTPAPPPVVAPVAPNVDTTISGQIAAMVNAKIGVEWKITKRGDQDVSDTAESYVYLGRILVKMLGDDIRQIDAETPMKLRMTLQSLPASFGKAPADWNLSFAEATSKAKAEGKPIGRSATTLNKYLRYLGAFLNFLEGSGIEAPALGKQIKASKAKKPKTNDAGFKSITDQEYVALFSDTTWTGVDVVHDSTYWVPLLTRYGGGRLEEPCGLLISDIDFDTKIPSYLIEGNWMRTIKTESRRIPFHSELLRLGFRQYYEAVRALGFRELFPDLRARGTRTAIGSLLTKKFSPILDRALPEARENKQTQHAARRTLNTELRNNSIDITIRREILGHAPADVNERNYTDPAGDEDKKRAIETIANVTKHVPARPIRLSSLLSRYPKDQ